MTANYSFTQLNWDSSVSLNGYQPSYTFYLPLAKHLHTQKAILHLKMDFSPLLTVGTRVDIKFNQTVIRRLALPTTSSKEASWDIELPLAQLSKDWQTLNFSAHLVSTKNLCDPNIWIYISPESSLTLTTEEVPFEGLLQQLPYPFIDPVTINPIPTMLVLPQNPSQQEIFSLLQIALQLGRWSGNSKVNLSTGYINESVELQKLNNLILIGIAGHLFPDNGLARLTQNPTVNKALDSHSGILLLSQSPFNPVYGLLAITGSDYAALKKAVTTFLAPESKAIVSGKLAIIDQVQIHPIIQSEGEWYKTTFKDLGYEDQSVTGLGQHKVSFNVPLPNDRIPHYATIKTLITAPIFPGNNYSQITLLVNGSKQSSFWLTKEHSSWPVEIDTSAMKPGINKIEYLVNLHINNELCTRENYDDLWATIYAESEFETSFLNNFPLAMLNQLLVPFSTEVTVILPASLSKEGIDNLANLFFKMGQLANSNPIIFNFRSSHEIDEDFIRNHNVILFGTPATNPWVKFALNYMPVQLQGNSRLLKLPQKQMQISSGSSTGLLELMPSPWSEGNAVLLITGDNNPALFSAVNALVSDKKRMNLNGNIAIINPDKSFEILNSYDNRYISLKHRLTIYMSNLGKNLLYYLSTHLQIFIYLIAILVPLFIIVRRRK
ncbi:cellulose biosynthesis cyclic di-GMP-binding regulatory protein BcsB [Legionella drozanskii]|nr:cellulose biosynthesis cyclic di-GMP-binding regulatory protein BcsB [Legionella drozanskii]